MIKWNDRGIYFTLLMWLSQIPVKLCHKLEDEWKPCTLNSCFGCAYGIANSKGKSPNGMPNGMSRCPFHRLMSSPSRRYHSLLMFVVYPAGPNDQRIYWIYPPKKGIRRKNISQRIFPYDLYSIDYIPKCRYPINYIPYEVYISYIQSQNI